MIVATFDSSVNLVNVLLVFYFNHFYYLPAVSWPKKLRICVQWVEEIGNHMSTASADGS